MDKTPVAWLIELTVGGKHHRVVCLHNSIADYRDIDPNAKSTPLYAEKPPKGGDFDKAL